MARRALDQSSRYADLSLDEATLIKSPGIKPCTVVLLKCKSAATQGVSCLTLKVRLTDSGMC